LPDARREFVAPAGRYAFVVTTSDGWKSGRGTGELFSVGPAGRTAIWSQELPQQFGPRFVLVNDQGTVLMLDEWINVSSRYAVLIIDREPRTIAQRSTDDVQAALQVPMNEIVRLAKFGWWIAAPPTLSPSGDAARVEAGGKILTIGLNDGSLSAS
jgi:hypothetical protein